MMHFIPSNTMTTSPFREHLTTWKEMTMTYPNQSEDTLISLFQNSIWQFASFPYT